MTTTFSVKPELLLSLTPRGYCVVYQAKTTRISENAGKVLSVLKGNVLSMPEICQRTALQHSTMTSGPTKAGLLELLRLELVDQNVVVDAPRWTAASRPDNRLAPPTIAPVKVKASAHAPAKQPRPGTRDIQRTDAFRLEDIAPRRERESLALEAPGTSADQAKALASPGVLAVLSFSLMLLLGLPIWRLVLGAAP
jgi:hypothetical protein